MIQADLAHFVSHEKNGETKYTYKSKCGKITVKMWENHRQNRWEMWENNRFLLWVIDIFPHIK